MNRKSVIKHIIAEAKGKPILADEYSYRDVKENLSPIIKMLRKELDDAKRSVSILKSQMLRNQGQENWVNHARKINKLATHFFQIRNDIKHIVDEVYGETPMTVKKWAVSTWGRMCTMIHEKLDKIGLYIEQATRSKAVSAGDASAFLLDEIDELFIKMNDSLYTLTDGQLY